MEHESLTLPQKKKPAVLVVAIVGIVILLVAAVAAYFLYGKEQEPEKLDLGIQSVMSYVCPDDSNYVVIRKDQEISVSGGTFSRVGSEEPARFGNEGTVEFIINEESLTLVTPGTDEVLVTCTKGVPDSGVPPLVL